MRGVKEFGERQCSFGATIIYQPRPKSSDYFIWSLIGYQRARITPQGVLHLIIRPALDEAIPGQLVYKYLHQPAKIKKDGALSQTRQFPAHRPDC